MNAHEVFCRKLLDDFCGEITGRNVNCLEGVHPQRKFLVGMISPRNEAAEQTTNSSSVTVSQIGVDFFLREDDIYNAMLTVTLGGDLFYRTRPTLTQQRNAFMREVELRESGKDDFLSACEGVTDVHGGKGIKAVAIYHKLRLSEVVNIPLVIRLADFYDINTHSGRMPEDYSVNETIERLLHAKGNELASACDAYAKSQEVYVHLSDVLTEENWGRYLDRAYSAAVPMRQDWHFELSCDLQKTRSGLVRVSIKLNNTSKYQPDDTRGGKRASRETERVNDLYNANIVVQSDGAELQSFDLEYFHDDYKYDRKQYAHGSGCSVSINESCNRIETTLLPLFEQKRLKTRPGTEVKFSDLDLQCIKTLRIIKRGMDSYREKWIADRNNRSLNGELTEKGQEQFEAEINDFRVEIDRFCRGIDILERNHIVRQAFLYMNRAFQNSAKGYTGWRLFQIVFIVSLVPDIVACDPDLLTHAEKMQTHLSDMDLLYFPTGGGKTEAFLGILVFNLFFDRLRGKAVGVTAILKYPLRLLSVQQVQRVTDILASAELIRREIAGSAPGDPFAVGYFVGQSSTPTKIENEEKAKLVNGTQEFLDEEYRVVDICPFCHKKTVHIKYNSEKNRLQHVCHTPNCASNGILPLYIVDYDIYRYLPSVIISTIDKMAIIGLQNRFKSLFGSVSQKCPLHGYHMIGNCEEASCREVQEEVSLYDAAPTLFIQDELHLVRESLGTYDSHYESLIQYMISDLSDSHRPAKLIGATATISSYENQVKNLYNRKAIRFPCASPYLGSSYAATNYYAKEDENDLQRLVLGYTPYGRSIIQSVVYSMKAMRVCINRYREHPEDVLAIDGIGINSIDEALKIVEDYWIMLEYNNVKVDGDKVLNALEDPINTELADEGIPPFETRKMTGDDTFQDVRRTLAEVEAAQDIFMGFNLIVATSMISHGVDADKFNNMMFFGIPGNMAEYIQAYSRVGRKYPGIVIDIMRPTREREISWEKNFVKFHQYKDILVDPVPINRWASKAIEQTLSGIFSALILTHYMYALKDKREKIYMMDGLKKAIEKGWIQREEVKQHMYKIYGCGDQEFQISRGNQYRTKIAKMVDVLFDQITNSAYTKSVYITQGLPWHVMRSLRDTDDELLVELK